MTRDEIEAIIAELVPKAAADDEIAWVVLENEDVTHWMIGDKNIDISGLEELQNPSRDDMRSLIKAKLAE